MNNNGWFKIHRELFDKSIWLNSSPEQKAILITLLSMASHCENSWEWGGRKFKIQPGQMITSLESIAQKAGTGISVQNIRTALKRFEKLEFLTNESTKRGRLITIVNWRVFQDDDSLTNKQSNSCLTNTSQTPNNYQELKEYNNSFVPDESATKKKRKFVFSQEHMQLAEHLKSRILEHRPNFKYPNNLDQWANEIRLMMEQDNRPFEEIIAVINWCQRDSFWQGNILSADKLRKKFDQLQAKMAATKQKSSFNPSEWGYCCD